jgi:hypothetical protein
MAAGTANPVGQQMNAQRLTAVARHRPLKDERPPKDCTWQHAVPLAQQT